MNVRAKGIRELLNYSMKTQKQPKHPRNHTHRASRYDHNFKTDLRPFPKHALLIDAGYSVEWRTPEFYSIQE